jgi:hypothetical protein
VWILPEELGPIALPEGVLLLPHHYAADDRERLLALMRVALPGSRQLVVEGAALEGLIARGVDWSGGLVLVHGLASDTEVDDLRGMVGPLRAKHALVQLPQPQAVGTSWMESLLKVPVLRALEREWKNPAHPLRVIGIDECPLREAAQYTDEPVELLAIVTAMVEHRIAHASVGVEKGDWGRSLDQALAGRLRGRLPVKLDEAGFEYLMGVESGRRPLESLVDQLVAGGLGSDLGVTFRGSPIVQALRRTLTRVYLVPLSSSVAAERQDDIDVESSRFRDLCHMSAELWSTGVRLPTLSGLPQRLLHTEDAPSWRTRRSLDRSHQILEMSDQQREEVTSVLVWSQSFERQASAVMWEELRVFQTFVKGITEVGRDACEAIDRHIATLRSLAWQGAWNQSAVMKLNLLWAYRAISHRKTLSDVRFALGRLAQCSEVAPSYLLEDAAKVSESGLVGPGRAIFPRNSMSSHLNLLSAIASGAKPSAAVKKRFDSASVRRGSAAGRPRAISPKTAWEELWCGNYHRVLQCVSRIGNTVGARLAVEDLHGFLAVGVAALTAGDLDTATQYANSVLDLATRYEIPVLRAFARELLAAVHELRGEYDIAAKLLFQSRARYIALEDTARILGVEQRLTRMGITFDPAASPRRKRTPRAR